MENQPKHSRAKREALMLFDNLVEINENVEEDAYEEAKRILQRRRMRKNKNHK